MIRRAIIACILLLVSLYAFCADFGRDLKLTQPRMNGDDVLAVQEVLLSLGFQSIGTADSWFGPKTQVAVKSYQRYMGFAQDGIVNQKLWQTMFSTEELHRRIAADIRAANSYSLDKLSKSEKPLMGYSTEGGSITRYNEGRQTRYAEIDFYGETGKVNYDVYLIDNRRILLKKTYQYPQPFDVEHAQIDDTAYYYYENKGYQLLEGMPTAVDYEAVDVLDFLAK